MMLKKDYLLTKEIINLKSEIYDIAFLDVGHIPPDDRNIFEICIEIVNRINNSIRINTMMSDLGSEFRIPVDINYNIMQAFSEMRDLTPKEVKEFFKAEKAFNRFDDISWKFIDFNKLYWKNQIPLMVLGIPISRHESKLFHKIVDDYFDLSFKFYSDQITYSNFLKKAKEQIAPLMHDNG